MFVFITRSLFSILLLFVFFFRPEKFWDGRSVLMLFDDSKILLNFVHFQMQWTFFLVKRKKNLSGHFWHVITWDLEIVSCFFKFWKRSFSWVWHGTFSGGKITTKFFRVDFCFILLFIMKRHWIFLAIITNNNWFF